MYSSSEYVDMILTFARCGNNAREAVRLYREQFPQRQSHPDHKTILQLIARGQETGQMQPVRRRSWGCFKKCKDCRTRGSRIECL
jgi:hypothetical protein